MWEFAGWLFLGLQGVVIAISLYHSGIIVLGSLRSARPVGVRPEGADTSERIGLIVCAHNEERVIAGVLADLSQQSYPRERYRVLVVAHDCTDRTVEISRGFEGVEVVELSAPGGGKAAAVARGLEWYGNTVDLVGVLDADVELSSELLVEVGGMAGSHDVIQVETRPASTATATAAAYGMSRRGRALLWWRPRSRLGLSVVFHGGVFFVRPGVLEPYMRNLRSMTEDLELAARVVANGGRIGYLEKPLLGVVEPTSVGSSFGQRVRWARGHLAVIRWELFPLLRSALRGHLPGFDLALYLLVPTRMLTRLSLTAVLVIGLLEPSLTLPLWLLLVALAGEWLLPAAIALGAGLVTPNARDLTTVARVTGLSLLWVPVGLVAMGTVRTRTWFRVPRTRHDRGNAETRGGTSSRPR